MKLNRFWFGLWVIWLFALALRFWQLGQFNTLVFDEIYFAKFGHNYLTHTSFFDVHPPLGKYMIALGIWLQGFNTWGFRWMNALTGSFIPLLVTGIAYQLTQRRSYALIAGGLAALDGLLLVESRYALINVYLVLFGLLGHWFCLRAVRRQDLARWRWLTLSAISFGACAAVKWNGLGFLLGLYLSWIAGWIVTRLGPRLQQTPIPRRSPPLQKLELLSLVQLFGYIPAIAALVYGLAWIPHLLQNPSYDVVQVHQEILSYHQYLGGGQEIHPYCSAWYTWPLLLRSISYLYQTAVDLSESIPITGPPLPGGAARYLYSIYALGNPPLWWLSTAAILGILGRWCWQLWQRPPQSEPAADWLGGRAPLTGEKLWVPLYLGANFAANWLPWAIVSRCTFLYHYLGASLFSGLALAWVVDHWLSSPYRLRQWAGLAILGVCGLGFVYWAPFFLGLPLSPEAWRARIWLPSWI